tara:strand:- start:1181 stop:2392 length:1212 start_codon:yes stop_codon:yes gene_type:complete
LTKNETFCVAPFIHQSMKTDGCIKLCCQSLPEIANHKKTTTISGEVSTMKEAWNNDVIKQVRLDLTQGVKNKRCNICWEHEKNNVKSLRQKYNNKPTMMYYALDAFKHMQKDGTIHSPPKWLELKLSNLCNFACRMCHVMDSTSWFDDWKHVHHFSDPYWKSHIEGLNLLNKPYLGANDDFFDGVDLSEVRLLQFAGGEPLYDEKHYKALDKVIDRADKITLNYATNLSNLGYKKYNVLDYWKKFKFIHLSVSLDGPREKNDYIRHGSNWQTLEKNIKEVQKLNNVHIVGKCTLQTTNIYYLPETLEWFREMGIDRDVHYVMFPKWFDCRSMPNKIKDYVIRKLGKMQENKKFKSSVINYLKQDLYNEENWKTFFTYNATLDKLRNQNLFDTFPILEIAKKIC